MSPLHTYRLCLVGVVVALAIGGCATIYRCTYQSRFVGAAPDASVVDKATPPSYVNFRDYDERGPVPAAIIWSIRFDRSVGKLTALTLRDKRDTTVVLANMFTQLAEGEFYGSTNVLAKAERDRAFDVLASGNGALVMTVSGVASPIVVPLHVTDKDDWHRPNCS